METKRSKHTHTHPLTYNTHSQLATWRLTKHLLKGLDTNVCVGFSFSYGHFHVTYLLGPPMDFAVHLKYFNGSMYNDEVYDAALLTITNTQFIFCGQ